MQPSSSVSTNCVLSCCLDNDRIYFCVLLRLHPLPYAYLMFGFDDRIRRPPMSRVVQSRRNPSRQENAAAGERRERSRASFANWMPDTVIGCFPADSLFELPAAQIDRLDGSHVEDILEGILFQYEQVGCLAFGQRAELFVDAQSLGGALREGLDHLHRRQA